MRYALAVAVLMTGVALGKETSTGAISLTVEQAKSAAALWANPKIDRPRVLRW